MRANAFSIISLIGCLILCFVAAAIGSFVTFPAIPGWYEGLVKPDFNPPNWLFGPVWTILYTLMAIALWRIVNLGHGRERALAIAAFAVQLALNVAWSLVFFGGHAPVGGLIVIILLLAAIIVTITRFGPIDRLAGWLLAPYLIWVGFASVLNLAIVILN